LILPLELLAADFLWLHKLDTFPMVDFKNSLK